MKQLKNLIKLSQSVKIYVPSTVNVNESINNEKYVTGALIFLAECFGGATSYEAFGSWIASNGSIVKERVTLCTSFCNEAQLESHIEKLYDYCVKLKLELGQEAIALEVNNVLHFI